MEELLCLGFLFAVKTWVVDCSDTLGFGAYGDLFLRFLLSFAVLSAFLSLNAITVNCEGLLWAFVPFRHDHGMAV